MQREILLPVALAFHAAVDVERDVVAQIFRLCSVGGFDGGDERCEFSLFGRRRSRRRHCGRDKKCEDLHLSCLQRCFSLKYKLWTFFYHRGPAAASAVAAAPVVPLLLRNSELMNRAVILSATPPMTARTKSCADGWRNAFVNTVNCFCAFCKSSSPLEMDCSPPSLPVDDDDDDDDDEEALA